VCVCVCVNEVPLEPVSTTAGLLNFPPFSISRQFACQGHRERIRAPLKKNVSAPDTRLTPKQGTAD
jgi:hypothetical protein